jgi:ribonuclease HII
MLQAYFSPNSQLEAGCDEVGRGCLAGPVVAAAVILPKDFEHNLVRDSKTLKPKERELAEDYIHAHAIDFAIAEVSHTEIDQINILNASYLAMHRAISQLKCQPDLLLIDGNRFKAYGDVPHECIIKGDNKFYSIAAASILAKNYRDALMMRLAKEYPHYGWASNVGYPSKAHRQAIMEHGLTPYHRKSFKLKISQLNLF